MRIQIAKHIEHRHIEVSLSNSFMLEQISDDIIISLVHNIENRIAFLKGADNE